MRVPIKYKIFSKRVHDVIPSRVVNFKNSKWLKNKRFILSVLKNHFSKVKHRKILEKQKKKKRLSKLEKQFLTSYNQKLKLVKEKKEKIKSKYGILVSLKKMPRIKNHFKVCLETSIMLKQFFGYRSQFSVAATKEKNFDLIYKNVFIKQFFKVEILLWKLNFFKSTEEAVQHLSHGKILINGFTKSPNYFLKKGDIITFLMPVSDVSFLNENVLKSKSFLKRSLYPFVEMDFLSKTVVILKDEHEISLAELFYFTPFLLNIRHLRN
jgi:ribosomal protein S4